MDEILKYKQEYQKYIKMGYSKINAASEAKKILKNYGQFHYININEYNEPLFISINNYVFLYDYGIYKKIE